MDFIISVLFLLLAISSTQAHTEVVWLEDTNDDHDKRNLEMGLPSQLEFNLKRENGQQMKLQLQENTGLNPNAPVFTTVIEYGVQKAIRIETKPIVGTKFYHDKKALAAVMVSCKIQEYGPCKRFVKGSLHIEGEGYEIKPSPTLLAVRSVGANSDVPHIIEKVYSQQKKGPSAKGEHVQGTYGTKIKWEPDPVDLRNEAPYTDYMIPPDYPPFVNLEKDWEQRNVGETKRSTDPAEGIQETSYTDYMIPPDVPPFFDLGSDWERRNDKEAKRSIKDPADGSQEAPYINYMIPSGDRAIYTSNRVPPKPKVRSRRGKPASLEEGKDISDGQKHSSGRHERSMQKRMDDVFLHLKMLMVIDPPLWKKYYERTSANNGMDKDEAAMYALRERLVHVMNGASLNFLTIEDPNTRFDIIISGFIFYKTVDISNPLNPSVSVTVAGDVELVDKGLYLHSILGWSLSISFYTTIVPRHDLEMIMTGYDLYKGSVENNGADSTCYLDGICGTYMQTLVEEDNSYFRVTNTATHVVAHNLGARDDGSGASKDCPASDHFIMTPAVPQFGPNTPYNPNLWRFSNCSIKQLDDFIQGNSADCLYDEPHTYNTDEWAIFSSKEPGELYTPAEQCAMLMGETSNLCGSVTNEAICRGMPCYRNGYCHYYLPARGTPCGEPNLKLTCAEGLCGGRMPQTGIPETTTYSTNECVDRGWRNWSCQRISKYFLAVYSYQPIEWCQYSYWQHACCKLCKEPDGPMVTTTSALPTTTDVCEDSNYYSWSCARVSEYFAETFKLPPKKWCADPDWSVKCCEYCKNNSA